MATRMLELLGDMLRQVLAAERQNEVPLRTEVAFLEQYLAIEQIRFADRLEVTWRIDDTARAALVPIFVLQPLVENAVRHGVMPRAEGGRITIAARAIVDRLELTVEDDGVGIREGQAEGVGLRNTRERLRTLYGDQASLSIRTPAAGGTLVVVTLPVRRERDAS